MSTMSDSSDSESSTTSQQLDQISTPPSNSPVSLSTTKSLQNETYLTLEQLTSEAVNNINDIINTEKLSTIKDFESTTKQYLQTEYSTLQASILSTVQEINQTINELYQVVCDKQEETIKFNRLVDSTLRSLDTIYSLQTRFVTLIQHNYTTIHKLQCFSVRNSVTMVPFLPKDLINNISSPNNTSLSNAATHSYQDDYGNMQNNREINATKFSSISNLTTISPNSHSQSSSQILRSPQSERLPFSTLQSLFHTSYFSPLIFTVNRHLLLNLIPTQIKPNLQNVLKIQQNAIQAFSPQIDLQHVPPLSTLSYSSLLNLSQPSLLQPPNYSGSQPNNNNINTTVLSPTLSTQSNPTTTTTTTTASSPSTQLINHISSTPTSQSSTTTSTLLNQTNNFSSPFAPTSSQTPQTYLFPLHLLDSILQFLTIPEIITLMTVSSEWFYSIQQSTIFQSLLITFRLISSKLTYSHSVYLTLSKLQLPFIFQPHFHLLFSKYWDICHPTLLNLLLFPPNPIFLKNEIVKKNRYSAQHNSVPTSSLTHTEKHLSNLTGLVGSSSFLGNTRPRGGSMQQTPILTRDCIPSINTTQFLPRTTPHTTPATPNLQNNSNNPNHNAIDEKTEKNDKSKEKTEKSEKYITQLKRVQNTPTIGVSITKYGESTDKHDENDGNDQIHNNNNNNENKNCNDKINPNQSTPQTQSSSQPTPQTSQLQSQHPHSHNHNNNSNHNNNFDNSPSIPTIEENPDEHSIPHILTMNDLLFEIFDEQLSLPQRLQFKPVLSKLYELQGGLLDVPHQDDTLNNSKNTKMNQNNQGNGVKNGPKSTGGKTHAHFSVKIVPSNHPITGKALYYVDLASVEFTEDQCLKEQQKLLQPHSASTPSQSSQLHSTTSNLEDLQRNPAHNQQNNSTTTLCSRLSSNEAMQCRSILDLHLHFLQVELEKLQISEELVTFREKKVTLSTLKQNLEEKSRVMLQPNITSLLNQLKSDDHTLGFLEDQYDQLVEKCTKEEKEMEAVLLNYHQLLQTGQSQLKQLQQRKSNAETILAELSAHIKVLNKEVLSVGKNIKMVNEYNLFLNQMLFQLNALDSIYLLHYHNSDNNNPNTNSSNNNLNNKSNNTNNNNNNNNSPASPTSSKPSQSKQSPQQQSPTQSPELSPEWYEKQRNSSPSDFTADSRAKVKQLNLSVGSNSSYNNNNNSSSNPGSNLSQNHNKNNYTNNNGKNSNNNHSNSHFDQRRDSLNNHNNHNNNNRNNNDDGRFGIVPPNSPTTATNVYSALLSADQDDEGFF